MNKLQTPSGSEKNETEFQNFLHTYVRRIRFTKAKNLQTANAIHNACANGINNLHRRVIGQNDNAMNLFLLKKNKNFSLN